MSKIGDLIVRLRLRREDYEQGLDKSKRKTDDFAASMKKSWTAAAGQIAAVTAAVYGTVKALDKVAHQSQQLGDAWDRRRHLGRALGAVRPDGGSGQGGRRPAERDRRHR